MADSLLEVPVAEVVFPQICASCASGPPDTTLRVQRAQAAQARWYFFFGLIGAAIANAARGGQGTVRLDIPYCNACRKRDRTLGTVAWVLVGVGFLFACGATLFATSLEQEATTAPVMIASSWCRKLPAGGIPCRIRISLDVQQMPHRLMPVAPFSLA